MYSAGEWKAALAGCPAAARWSAIVDANGCRRHGLGL